MKLIHYSGAEFELEQRNYDQSNLSYRKKPRGFWVSAEGLHEKDQTWKTWCEAENFCLERLKVSYEVRLNEKVNILHLKTEKEILDFTQQYFYIKSRDNSMTGAKCYISPGIDWERVAKEFQGIIIAPYQWNCRLDDECGWYYGWDCASGCIWDLSCVKELKVIETNECDGSSVESLHG